MARHDNAGIIAALQQHRVINRSITPAQYDELEELGYVVSTQQTEPDQFGKKLCRIERRMELTN